VRLVHGALRLTRLADVGSDRLQHPVQVLHLGVEVLCKSIELSSAHTENKAVYVSFVVNNCPRLRNPMMCECCLLLRRHKRKHDVVTI
jgi:hypothetical protein